MLCAFHWHQQWVMTDFLNCNAQKKGNMSMDQSPKVKAGLELQTWWTAGLEAVWGGRELVSQTVVETIHVSCKEPGQGWGAAPPYREDKNASINHGLGFRFIPIKMRKSKYSPAARIWPLYQMARWPGLQYPQLSSQDEHFGNPL